jgi:hypothetical protein
MGNLFTEGVGNILTVLLGYVLTARIGKVLDISREQERPIWVVRVGTRRAV